MSDAQARLLLATRRERLVQRAQEQRLMFAEAVAPLARSWVWAERGFVLWRAVRSRPWLMVGSAAALLLWRPRTAVRAAAGASALWRAAKFAQRMLGIR